MGLKLKRRSNGGRNGGKLKRRVTVEDPPVKELSKIKRRGEGIDIRALPKIFWCLRDCCWRDVEVCASRMERGFDKCSERCRQGYRMINRGEVIA